MFQVWIDSNKRTIIETARELLRIPSIGTEPAGHDKPFGKETDQALKFMLDLGTKYGFRVKNADGYAGHVEYGESKDYVAVLTHLDVVPPGNDWTYPPFAAEIHGNKIFARGAIDDKGPAMAAFFGLLAVKESGLPINRRTRLIFGLDEETDWRCMKHYFQVEPLPWGGFTPDADFPLIYAEKGILHFTLRKSRYGQQGMKVEPVEIIGGERPNMVPDVCMATLSVETNYQAEFLSRLEQYCQTENISFDVREIKPGSVLLTIKGQSAHGSTPDRGVNAIRCMGKVLSQFPVADLDLWEFVALSDTEGRFLGIDCSDSFSGALSCNLGMISMDTDSFKLVFDVRYPVDRTGTELVKLVQQTISSLDFLIDVHNDKQPLYVPKESSVVRTLQQVYERITGASGEPLAIGGGTYARAIPNTVAFGPLFPGMKDLAHQRDEFIEIEHLLQLTNIYAHAIYELSK
ncbi:dipeptidase PepV [Effusibacillus lacus]|uniref:Dipeptidase PepV n=1 Tax=Effusibacillus lacus TaxID=1348429 RepID=A0A292YHY2_9BACL|nr:dipeptidase PepV [Effusibacillus lacus]TCS73206.1 succinyl-diaminopimelate desuccinylase [Effusibacillus lacus]GAX90607.1 dipeptidase PepV [Effusibacillus lacus]